MKKKNKIKKSEKNLNEEFKTKRVTVNKLDKILYKSFKVLDKGFIRVIDYMGNDASIVQAARVSYGKGTKKLNQDRNLINYLLSHRHSTPFEMNEIKFHIKLPIFVARQWIRHRTASVNEYSARYSLIENEFYTPKVQDIEPQAVQNNQGRSGKFDNEESSVYRDIIKNSSDENFKNYFELLNINNEGEVINQKKKGIARELARMVLPLNSYTQWYWKIDLHNLMHFLSLRFDKHAQYEIRVYADIMLQIMKKWVPMTYDAFIKNKLDSLTLSSDAIKYLRNIIKNKNVDESEISRRELESIKKIFDL